MPFNNGAQHRALRKRANEGRAAAVEVKSTRAVPAAAAAVGLLLPPAALLPQQLHELGGVVQQQREDGDVRDAAKHNARAGQVVSLPYTHEKSRAEK